MSPPCVLCLSGHDPTGGAGLTADIEAIGALGGHALGVITANTVQDTSNVQRVAAVPPILMAAQIEALVADCRIGAIKI
ncbi:MAG TPA: bifunctional hydroxymethylpyrimidine kinase/phosphomethylpyrimidine kinase, partial [Solimonas sp.]